MSISRKLLVLISKIMKRKGKDFDLRILALYDRNSTKTLQLQMEGRSDPASYSRHHTRDQPDQHVFEKKLYL